MPETRQAARKNLSDSDFVPESPKRHLGIVAMPTLVDKDGNPVTDEVVSAGPTSQITSEIPNEVTQPNNPSQEDTKLAATQATSSSNEAKNTVLTNKVPNEVTQPDNASQEDSKPAATQATSSPEDPKPTAKPKKVMEVESAE